MNWLLRNSYGRACEPGCSVGELTAQLATVCDEVIAFDIAPSAVAQAQKRCAELKNVEISCADVASRQPSGLFDLIIFSEIGYYFDFPQLEHISRSLACRLTPGGEFVAAHWLGHSADHVLHGDEVHRALLANLPLQWVKGARYAGFRIDSWRHP
jgi:protein-L-isoaspartate O-methyltransferase